MAGRYLPRLPRLFYPVFLNILVATPLFAMHGGGYRQPGLPGPPRSRGGRASVPKDYVPPTTGHAQPGQPGSPSTPTGTPSTPKSPTPATPGSSGAPSTGAPVPAGNTPRGRAGSPTSGRGFQLSEDFSGWNWWWEYNKDAFLDLRSKVRSGRVITGSDDFYIGRGRKSGASATLSPNATDRKRAREALFAALTEQKAGVDLLSSCLLALARVGLSSPDLPRILPFLRHANQEVRESAALAIGIAGLEVGVPDLLALAQDNSAGRKLVGGGRVSVRTRVFAIYGLGLLVRTVGQGRTGVDPKRGDRLRQSVFSTLRDLLLAKDPLRQDLEVAAIQGLRLMDPPHSLAGVKLRSAMRTLVFNFASRGSLHRHVTARAHAVTALTEMATQDDAGAREFLLSLLDQSRAPLHLRRSAALGLGNLLDRLDADGIALLRQTSQRATDLQTRRFALLSLGKIGGAAQRDYLLKRLKSPRSRDQDLPWIGFALALLERRRRRAAPESALDVTLAEALLTCMEKRASGFTAAGLAIPLGLIRYRPAGEAILERLERYAAQDRVAGYLAVALGLLGDQDARKPLRALLAQSARRETRFAKLTTALGLLGDPTLGPDLVQRLRQSRTVVVHAAVATGLGYVGDRRTISDIIGVLKDHELRGLQRAFAAVALGLVASKQALPWREPLTRDLNYLANVETLSDGSAGILDLL